MAAFNSVTVTGSAWVDLNTLSGAAVGTEMQIQNIGTAGVRLQESTTLPVNNNGGVLFPPQYGELSISYIETDSLKMWAKLVDPNKTTVLAIFE